MLAATGQQLHGSLSMGSMLDTTQCLTSGSAMAEGPRDALVSRNSATTKHPIWKLEFQVYRMALFVCSYV